MRTAGSILSKRILCRLLSGSEFISSGARGMNGGKPGIVSWWDNLNGGFEKDLAGLSRAVLSL